MLFLFVNLSLREARQQGVGKSKKENAQDHFANTTSAAILKPASAIAAMRLTARDGRAAITQSHFEDSRKRFCFPRGTLKSLSNRFYAARVRFRFGQGLFSGDRVGHKVGSREKGLKGSGIGPEAFHYAVGKFSLGEIAVVEVGDFEFAAFRRAQSGNTLKNRVVVEVNADYSVGRERILGLFLDADDSSILENRNAKTARIRHFLQQNVSPFAFHTELRHGRGDAFFNDVVAEDHADGRAVSKRLRQAQGIRDAAFAHLIGIIQLPKAKRLSVSQQPQEIARILPAGDQEYLANARFHESPQWEVNHGLVVYRKQVLVRDL